MAIDTALKRASVINAGPGFVRLLPRPMSAVIDVAARAMLCFCYSGLPYAPPVPPPPPPPARRGFSGGGGWLTSGGVKVR